MWLPILLMVMALMVIFGNAVVWKLRAATTARHAVWRARTPRTGAIDPKPLNFPDPSSMAAGDGESLQRLDDPRIDHVVVRGPSMGLMGVNRDLLDPTRGERVGAAEITHDYPMLGKMGEYDFAVDHPLLDDQWRYWEMGIGRNTSRRIPYIYDLPKAPEGFKNAFSDAASEILFSPSRRDLDPLDRDPDWRAYRGGSPDFHPRLGRFCELDPQVVEETRVRNLVNRIQGKRRRPSVSSVAERMGRAFASLFRAQANQLKNMMPQPPGAAGQISALEEKARQYEDFAAMARSRRPP